MDDEETVEFTTKDGMREDITLQGNAPGQGKVLWTDAYPSPRDESFDPFHLEGPSSDENVTFVRGDGPMEETTLYGPSHDDERSEFKTLLDQVGQDMGLDTSPSEAPEANAGDQTDPTPASGETPASADSSQADGQQPAQQQIRLDASVEMNVYRDGTPPPAGASDEDSSLGDGGQNDGDQQGSGLWLYGGVAENVDANGPPIDLSSELDPLPSPQLVAETPIWDPAGGPPPDDLPEGAYVMGSSSATTDVHAELYQGGDEHPWPDIPGGGDDEFSAPGDLPVAPPASESPEDLQSWANDTGAGINQALQETVQGTDEEHPWTDDPNAQGGDEFSQPADPAQYVSDPESPGYAPASPLYNPSFDWSRSDGNVPAGSGDGGSGGDDGPPVPQYQQDQTIAAATDSVENDNIDTLAMLTPMVANTYMYTIDDSALNPAPTSEGAPGYDPSAAPQAPAESGQPDAQPSDPSGAPADPSSDPSSDPSADPSNDPSNDPSGDPSGDPSYDPSADQPDSGGDPAPAPSIPDVPPPAPEAPADGGGGDGGLSASEGLGAMAGFQSDETWTHFGSVDPALDPSHDAAHDSSMTFFDHEHGAF